MSLWNKNARNVASGAFLRWFQEYFGLIKLFQAEQIYKINWMNKNYSDSDKIIEKSR